MTKIGFAITGSFCTFKKTIDTLIELSTKNYEIIPIFSYNTNNLDTRFFLASDFREKIIEITGREPICDIVSAEPLGTRDKLDLMVVAPCTGNTLAKIAHGITDTPVTMAVKAHLRNSRPVLIALSSNDALGANAQNIGALLNTKNIFFVPFGQDDPTVKTKSLIADFSKIPKSVELALQNIQQEPIFSNF